MIGAASGHMMSALKNRAAGTCFQASAHAAGAPRSTLNTVVKVATLRLDQVARIHSTELKNASYQRHEKPVGGNFIYSLALKDIGMTISVGAIRNAMTATMKEMKRILIMVG